MVRDDEFTMNTQYPLIGTDSDISTLRTKVFSNEAQRGEILDSIHPSSLGID